MGRYGPWVGGRPAGRPSETFRQHCFVAPYPEDDVEALIDRIGASQVLFGSDFPHPEGLADPLEFLRLVENRSDEEIRMVMRDNAEHLLPARPRHDGGAGGPFAPWAEPTEATGRRRWHPARPGRWPSGPEHTALVGRAAGSAMPTSTAERPGGASPGAPSGSTRATGWR